MKVLGFVVFVLSFIGMGALTSEFIPSNWWFTAGGLSMILSMLLDKLVSTLR